MNITHIINDFSCGVYYTKNSILYYINKQGKYKKTKFSKVEYEMLNYLSLDIKKNETNFISFNFVSFLTMFILIFFLYFSINAIVLSTRGLSIEKIYKMKILKEKFYDKDIEDMRILLTNKIKSDYPNIKINDKEINSFELKQKNNSYGGIYLTEIFNENIILVYDNEIDYKTHEVIHHLSNHGFNTGWRNKFSNKYIALNEGMAEYIRNKYILETKVIYQEYFYVDALISVFGEETIMRSYFDNSNKTIEELINTYSNDFNLINEIDLDHLKNNNVLQINDYITQIFLNYLQKNQQEIVDFDSYVNNFIVSIIKNYDKESIEKNIIYNRIIKDVLAINDKYTIENNYLVQY